MSTPRHGSMSTSAAFIDAKCLIGLPFYTTGDYARLCSVWVRSFHVGYCVPQIQIHYCDHPSCSLACFCSRHVIIKVAVIFGCPHSGGHNWYCLRGQEAFMRGTEKYAHETQLSKRVGAWQEKLEPLMERQAPTRHLEPNCCNVSPIFRISDRVFPCVLSLRFVLRV